MVVVRLFCFEAELSLSLSILLVIGTILSLC
jgi:hypothetical protein